jgi:hypothetical protein
MTLTLSKAFLIVAVILLVWAALRGDPQWVNLALLAAAFYVAAQLGL